MPPNVLRLSKSQLDGACSDVRYSDDFFLDLIFEKVDAETATMHLEEQEGAEENEDTTAEKMKPVIKASSYDAMLNGDSRFWDVIEARKKEHAKQKNDNPMWGPTIGRRRGESKKKESKSMDSDGQRAKTKEEAQLEAFSIGNDFDFLPTEITPPPESKTVEPQKDSLMEALNALDHDENSEASQPAHDQVETEEVVFGGKTDGPAFDDSIPLDGTTTSVEGKDAEKLTRGGTDDIGESIQLEAKEENQIGVTDDDDLEDMDALLASVDDDFGDVDLADFDVDDDLDDLENMLKNA